MEPGIQPMNASNQLMPGSRGGHPGGVAVE